MRKFRFVAVLLSLALVVLLVFSISGGPSAEAHDEEDDDEIKTKFDLVENTALVHPITGASGLLADGLGGKIEIDGEDLDKLKFKVKYKAQGLEPNTWYYLAVTVRESHTDGTPDETFPGGIKPVAIAVAGMARTDGAGRLEFEGKGVLPNVFDDPVTSGVSKWRIDQQVRQIGSGELRNCVECILVCRPTTKVELNEDGDGLIKFVSSP
ncbi:MAG: hypothetical protein IH862_10005 [Chloroflexi bacterium]|nr:hypothetical protein [Chloroflexota bacterium]